MGVEPSLNEEDTTYAVHQVVAAVKGSLFTVQWKVREGCRVRKGQLLGVLSQSSPSSTDLHKTDIFLNGFCKAPAGCTAVATHRILSPATGRVADRYVSPSAVSFGESRSAATSVDETASLYTHRVHLTGAPEPHTAKEAALNLSPEEKLSFPLGDHRGVSPRNCSQPRSSDQDDTFIGTEAAADVVLCRVIEEPCRHTVVVEGLCTECGYPVSTDTISSGLEANDKGTSQPYYTQKLGFVAPGSDISVSAETAKCLELEKVSLLLKSKKLPLILDLDNTLLHAYPLPPPADIGEILDDPDFRVVPLGDPLLHVPLRDIVNEKAEHTPPSSAVVHDREDRRLCNGNRDSQDGSDSLSSDPLGVVPHYHPLFDSEDVQTVVRRWESWVISVVSVDSSSLSSRHSGRVLELRGDEAYYRPYTCYFKLRPGVLNFLRRASEKFELYLFTAGTAVHAASSLHVLDPERRWFGTRVFTREDIPQLEGGALGLKTIQRIFPGEAATQNLVTVVDDCETVWSPESNIFKVHAYHWWPDPSLHPFLLLYCRRTPNGAGTHSEVPVKMVDPGVFSRIRAASFSMLNFCPSIIQLCQSPRRILPPRTAAGIPIFYPSSSLDGGHSSSDASSVPILSITTTPSTETTPYGDTNQVTMVIEEERGNSARFVSSVNDAHSETSSANAEEQPDPQKALSSLQPCTVALQQICDELGNGLEVRDADRDDGRGNGGAHQTASTISPAASAFDHAKTASVNEHDAETAEPLPLDAPRKRFRSLDILDNQEDSTFLEENSTSSPVDEGVGDTKAQQKRSRGQGSWLEKGFDRRRKGETQEELNARVLQTATENWTAPQIVKDTDRQLDCLWSILSAMRKEFFRQAGELDPNAVDINKLPSVKRILDSMRQKVLRNVVLKTTGIREAAIPNFHDTDLGRSVVALGGQLVPHRATHEVTHLLVGKETEFYVNARKQETFPHAAHLMWLEAALFTFRRFDESLFKVDHCEKRYRVFWDALYTENGGLVEQQPVLFTDTDQAPESTSDHETPTSSVENTDNGVLLQLPPPLGTTFGDTVSELMDTTPDKAVTDAVNMNLLEEDLLNAFV